MLSARIESVPLEAKLLSIFESIQTIKSQTNIQVIKTDLQTIFQVLYLIITSHTCELVQYYEQLQIHHAILIGVCKKNSLYGQYLDCSTLIENLKCTLFPQVTCFGEKCILVLSGKADTILPKQSVAKFRTIHPCPKHLIRSTNYSQLKSGNIAFGKFCLPHEILGIILSFNGTSLMKTKNLYSVNKDICHVLGGSTLGTLICAEHVTVNVPLQRSVDTNNYREICKFSQRNKHLKTFYCKTCYFGISAFKKCPLLTSLTLRTVNKTEGILKLVHLTELSLSCYLNLDHIKDIPLKKLKCKCSVHFDLRKLPVTLTDLSVTFCRTSSSQEDGQFILSPLNSLTRFCAKYFSFESVMSVCKTLSLEHFCIKSLLGSHEMSTLISSLKHMPLQSLKIKNRVINLPVCISQFKSLLRLKSLCIYGCITSFDDTCSLERVTAKINRIPPSMPHLKRAKLFLRDSEYWTGHCVENVDDRCCCSTELGLLTQKVELLTHEFDKLAPIDVLLFVFRKIRLQIKIDAYFPMWRRVNLIGCEKLTFNEFSIIARNKQEDAVFLRK